MAANSFKKASDNGAEDFLNVSGPNIAGSAAEDKADLKVKIVKDFAFSQGKVAFALNDPYKTLQQEIYAKS